MNISLQPIDFAAISPLLIVLVTALLVLLVESLASKQFKGLIFWIGISGLIAALYASFSAPESQNALLTPWLRFDSLSRFFNSFFLLIGLGVSFLSASFFQRFPASQGEYYFLLLSSVFGLMLIGYSADFLTLFLGLETLSISLYVLCGYMKKWSISHEASIKYFLMGSLAAALLLYGIALVYGATGTTNLGQLLVKYQNITSMQHEALFLGGIALVTLGLVFKAAIVPLHVWAPDVYSGAPTPVTAFMAVGTKVGAFAAFVRVFLEALPQFHPVWNEGIAFLAYLTLIYANLVALRQVQLRRFFAYSGISHSGFLLILFVVGTAEVLPVLMFYLIIYALATLGAFAVLSIVDERSEGVLLSDLKGLFHRFPTLSCVLAFCLLTLAGIPPTAGFFAKFFLFKVAVEAGYIALVVVGLLMTILSAYYYLRIVSVMFAEVSEERPILSCSWQAVFVGVTAVVFIVVLSVNPALLMDWVAWSGNLK